MAYKATNYQAAIKVLVEHGDITTFSQMLDPRLAGIFRMAAAAGMRRERFLSLQKAGWNFSDEEIRSMASHVGITMKKMRELILNDPLYKKKKPNKKKGGNEAE